jgi:hypothetical protein
MFKKKFNAMKKFLLLVLVAVLTLPALAQKAESPVYPYAENGKWGLINKEGEIVLKPKYPNISLFNSPPWEARFAVVTNEKGLKGALTPKGKLAAKIKYQFVDVQSKGKYLIVRNPEGAYGLVKTKNKKEVLKTEYKSISRFRGSKMGLSIVQKGDKYGCINEDGKMIAEPVYTAAEIRGGYLDYPDIKLTKEDGTPIILDCWGEPLEKKKARGGAVYDDDEEIVFEDQSIEEESAVNRAPSITHNKINVGGKSAFEVSVVSIGQKRQTVTNKDTIFGMDEIKKVYISYQGPRGRAADIIIGSKGGKLGVFNNKNEVLVPLEYDAIEEKGSRSYFILKKGDLVGLANHKGKQILDPLYSKIKIKNFIPTYNVILGSFEGYADRNGHVYLPAKAFLK